MDNDIQTKYDAFIKEFGSSLPALFLKPHFLEKNESDIQIMNHSKSKPHNAVQYYVHDPINVISKVVNYEDLPQDT